MKKSNYYEATKLYKSKEKASEVKEKINEYLSEKVDGKSVGIDVRLIFILAKTELRLKNKLEAEKLFKVCIKLDNKDVYARLELGKLYAGQGKEKEAEKLFKECLEIDENDLPSRLELGKLYSSQGREKEAEKLFKECLEIDENDLHSRLELGKLYISQGKNEDARKLLEECLTINPNDKLAQDELEKLIQQEKRINTEEIYRNYSLRKDGKIDGLSCMVAKYFEELPQEELEEAKKRFEYLRSLNPEEVTMETNDLVWYLKFRYKNITLMERFFKINDEGEYKGMSSSTLIIPNDVKIENGRVTKEQKALIARQVHKGDYQRLLREKMQEVERGYLKRNQDLDY